MEYKFTPNSIGCTWGSKCTNKNCTFYHQEQFKEYVKKNEEVRKENEKLRKEIEELRKEKEEFLNKRAWSKSLSKNNSPKNKQNKEKTPDLWTTSQNGWGSEAGTEDGQGW